jgi:hypothetical protein
VTEVQINRKQVHEQVAKPTHTATKTDSHCVVGNQHNQSGEFARLVGERAYTAATAAAAARGCRLSPSAGSIGPIVRVKTGQRRGRQPKSRAESRRAVVEVVVAAVVVVVPVVVVV